MCSASQQVAWDEVILAGFKLKLLQNMNATCATAAWLLLCFYPFVKKCYLKKILLTLILCHCYLKIAGSYRSQDQRGEWLFCQTWSFCNDSVVYCFYRTSLLLTCLVNEPYLEAGWHAVFFPKQSEKLLTAVTIQVCQLLIAGWHIFSFTHLGCATTKLFSLG